MLHFSIIIHMGCMELTWSSTLPPFDKTSDLHKTQVGKSLSISLPWSSTRYPKYCHTGDLAPFFIMITTGSSSSSLQSSKSWNSQWKVCFFPFLNFTTIQFNYVQFSSVLFYSLLFYLFIHSFFHWLIDWLIHSFIHNRSFTAIEAENLQKQYC